MEYPFKEIIRDGIESYMADRQWIQLGSPDIAEVFARHLASVIGRSIAPVQDRVQEYDKK